MNNGNQRPSGTNPYGSGLISANRNDRRKEVARPAAPATPPPASIPQETVKPQAAPPPKTQRINPQNDARALEAERKRRIAAAERKRREAEEKKRAEDARLAQEEKQLRENKKRISDQNKQKRREARHEKLIARFSDDRRKTPSESHIRINISKRIIKDALAYFAVFICVLLIICTGAATMLLWQILNYGERPETPSSVTFTAGEKDYDYDYSEIVRDGVYYVNFTTIAKMCDLSLGGDEKVIIYSTPQGEQIRFAPPSRNVLVNGNSVVAEGDIIVNEGTERRIWVPLSLVRDYMTGIDIKLEEGISEKTGKPFVTITASRIENDRDYLDVAFKLKYNSVLSGLSNESLPEEPVTLPADAPVYEFAANLTRYLKYMCPADYGKHMLLINPSHPSDASYTPPELVGVPNPRYDNGMTLTKDAAMSLEALFLEMHTLGFKDMKVSVAYRTFEQQEYQFSIYTYNERYYYHSHYETEGKWFSDQAYAVLGKSYLQEKYISQGKKNLSADDAKRVAMSYSAYPGTSDHQSGLGLDLYLPGYSGTKFAESDEYKWLVDNAHKFGFVFRYPDGKENITGYSFEPYHLRFVGQYHAAIIYESGLTLDQYIDKYIK